MNLPLNWRAARFINTHPEWWTLLLSAVAWCILLAYATAHDAHTLSAISLPRDLFNWVLMTVAMMFPLIIVPLRFVVSRSYFYRQHQAIVLFLLGFLTPWLALGVAATWLSSITARSSSLTAPALFFLSALWVLSPLRTHASVYCHATIPLAPDGWRADRDCLKFGALMGASCIGTCGILMLACALTAHNPIALIGGTVLGVMEYRSFRPPTGILFVGTLLLAFWFIMPFNYAHLP